MITGSTALAIENNSLRQQLAAVQVERDEAVYAVQRLSEGHPFDAIVIADTVKRMTAHTENQLAAAQADNTRLREALHMFISPNVVRGTKVKDILKALEMANTRLAAEREALEGVRVEMEAARQEAAELADQLTVELDETKSRLASIEAAESAARGEADALRDELAAMRERVATAEARAGELRTELDHAHTDAAAQRAKLEKAEAYGFDMSDRVNKLQSLVYEANGSE